MIRHLKSKQKNIYSVWDLVSILHEMEVTVTFHILGIPFGRQGQVSPSALPFNTIRNWTKRSRWKRVEWSQTKLDHTVLFWYPCDAKGDAKQPSNVIWYRTLTPFRSLSRRMLDRPGLHTQRCCWEDLNRGSNEWPRKLSIQDQENLWVSLRARVLIMSLVYRHIPLNIS